MSYKGSIRLFTIISIVTLLYSQNEKQLYISGRVLSEEETPLPYTNISVKDTDLGTISDLDGSFSLILTGMDTVHLLFHYIGYEEKTVTLTQEELVGQPITVVLKVGSLSFSPIEIIGESSLNRSKNIEPSLRILDSYQLTTIPSITGTDVFRALQNIPGVNSSSELSNQLYVRGGTPDQNLVLINGVPIYQPFHLFGLSSSVDGNAIDFVRYYSGGFSVRFGDRLSSVLDIVTKPGSDTLSMFLDLNLINSGATIAGSLGDNIRWRITGRRTYFDVIGKAAGMDFPYKFYDVEGKISYLPNSKSLITFNTFLSSDDYSTDYKRIKYNPIYARHPDPVISHADSNQYNKVVKNEIGWSNRLMSLRWMNRFSPDHMSEVTIYSSYLQQGLVNQKSFIPHPKASVSTLDEVRKENERWNFSPDISDANSGLKDIGVTLFHEWEISDGIEITFGSGYSKRVLDYFWNTADFEIISPYINVFMDFPPDSMDYDLELNTLYGFGEIIIKPIQNVFVRGGVRITEYSAYSKLAYDPRINLTWAFHPDWKIKAGLGRFTQALSSSIEYGFYSVASIYFPNVSQFPEAIHKLVGIIYDNRQNIYVDIAGYSKTFSNLLYFNVDGNARTGSGESHGVEFLGSYFSKSYSTQLAYGYSVAQKDQDGDIFYPNYDQRHKLSWQMNMKLRREWSLSANWSLSTGRPANLATSMAYSAGSYNVFETWAYTEVWPFVLDLPKNVFRYPVFHRLDILLAKKWRFRGGIFSMYIQILNLYNRNNVVYYEDIDEIKKVRPDPDNPGNKIVEKEYVAKRFNGFPFFPTIGLTYEF